MKFFISLLILITTITMPNKDSAFYNFNVENIDGDQISLKQYKGKVVLVVNVASKCGYTPQYEGLQKIYDTYKDKGFVILGFPANNFNGQEPGSDKQIKQFCTLEYGVEFPMFSKISVKGDDQAELFTYLTTQANPDFEGDIKWNFEKFLISKDGLLQRRFRSNVEPESDDLINAIEHELGK
jgi:glutathione peroxidase